MLAMMAVIVDYMFKMRF